MPITDMSEYAACWFHRAPARLVVTEDRSFGRNAGGSVKVLDSAGRQLACTLPSLRLNFDEHTRAFTPSPDDRLLASVVGTDLIVLHAADCSLCMREELSYSSVSNYSVWWSPSSVRIAVVVVKHDPSLSRSRVVTEWSFDARAKALLHASGTEDIPTHYSSCGPYTGGGLLFTKHPDASAGGHSVHLVHVAEVVSHNHIQVRALITPGWQHDYVHDSESAATAMAHTALSPDGSWLAFVSGEGLCAWSIQVVRLKTGRRVAGWQAPFGPTQDIPLKPQWLLTWSLDSRRLAVCVDAGHPAYCAQYLLAFDG